MKQLSGCAATCTERQVPGRSGHNQPRSHQELSDPMGLHQPQTSPPPEPSRGKQPPAAPRTCRRLLLRQLAVTPAVTPGTKQAPSTFHNTAAIDGNHIHATDSNPLKVFLIAALKGANSFLLQRPSHLPCVKAKPVLGITTQPRYLPIECPCGIYACLSPVPSPPHTINHICTWKYQQRSS